MSQYASVTARVGSARAAGPGAALLLVAWLGLLVPGSAPATSLQFFGNGENGIDRVKIRIDGPARPADVGATDFTLEWWMRALPDENASEDVTCDANDGWIFGNILFDRDIYNVLPGGAAHGDFGVSLTGGRVAFGVSAGISGNTICGTADVADGAWHHVAVTRRLSDGWLRIYVDGVLDAEGNGNVGSNTNVSYQDGRFTAYPNSDPFLVIGAEKHDAGPAYPSYHGWIDEVRLSTVQRYTATRFTRPFSLFAPDGSTAALYHLDEGAGNVIGDASGGGSHGTREYGGAPPGPEWSSNAAPLDTARRVALEQVVSGLTRPVAIAHSGDDRLFVVEADGRILVYQVTEDGPLTFLDTFLDIHGLVACCGERGLLGLAFHPSYASNGYLFVYYTRASDGDVVLARYQAPTAASNTADPGSASVLVTIEHSTYSNHNGGGLAFGPDGYLYVSIGDGGGGGDPLGSGQSLATLLGKVLRLDVDVIGDPAPHYEIPPGNPFVGTPGAREEIWAWGLRNPWRIAFDRLTGDLFIGDVGQGNREEVDFQLAGSPGGVNYGWPRMEGTACYSPSSGCQTGSLVLPILDYSHSEGCSVTGGYRYRGTGIPTLHGGYVFGDFCQGTIWVGAQAGNGTWSRTLVLDTSLSISTFGEDARGELYVAHLGGAIYRFVRARPRLTVTRAGSGTGTVSGPGGLDCGVVCSVEYEPGETVTLTATAAANSWFAGWSGACGGPGGCVVLMDGDRPVTATINPRVTEGSGSATITVQRLETTAGTVTVDDAIGAGSATAPPAADADFTGPGGALTGTLTFGPNQAVVEDRDRERSTGLVDGPRTVIVALGSPSGSATLGSPSTATPAIADNEPIVRFSSATDTVSESGTGAGVTVPRGGATTSTVTVNVQTTGTGSAAGSLGPCGTGVDVTAIIPPVTFNSGDISKVVTIPLCPDTEVEGTETIGLVLTDPVGATLGTPNTGTVQITENDVAGTVQFAVATTSASEAQGTASVLVTWTGGSASGVTAHWTITGGTATIRDDYAGPTSGTLTFGPSQMSQGITIAVVARAGAQGPRSIEFLLGGPGGGGTLGAQTSATLWILDAD
jgi:glucose/arabinose dehydrogenase